MHSDVPHLSMTFYPIVRKSSILSSIRFYSSNTRYTVSNRIRKNFGSYVIFDNLEEHIDFDFNDFICECSCETFKEVIRYIKKYDIWWKNVSEINLLIYNDMMSFFEEFDRNLKKRLVQEILKNPRSFHIVENIMTDYIRNM